MKVLIYIVFVLVLVVSCNLQKGEKGDPEPITTTNYKSFILEILSGPHRSSVNFKSDHHVNLQSITGNVMINVDGTSFGSISDKDSWFTIKNIPTGTYNLTFKKDGFGTVRWFGIQILPLTPTDSVFIGRVPFYPSINQICKIQLDSIMFDQEWGYFNYYDQPVLYFSTLQKNYFGSEDFNISGYFSGSSYPNYIFFFSKNKNVSSENYELYTSRYQTRCFVQANDTIVEVMVDDLKFLNEKFKNGDSIYVAGYGVNYYANGGDYYDPLLRKWIFTSLNQKRSNIFQFVLH